MLMLQQNFKQFYNYICKNKYKILFFFLKKFKKIIILKSFILLGIELNILLLIPFIFLFSFVIGLLFQIKPVYCMDNNSDGSDFINFDRHIRICLRDSQLLKDKNPAHPLFIPLPGILNHLYLATFQNIDENNKIILNNMQIVYQNIVKDVYNDPNIEKKRYIGYLQPLLIGRAITLHAFKNYNFYRENGFHTLFNIFNGHSLLIDLCVFNSLYIKSETITTITPIINMLLNKNQKDYPYNLLVNESIEISKQLKNIVENVNIQEFKNVNPINFKHFSDSLDQSKVGLTFSNERVDEKLWNKECAEFRKNLKRYEGGLTSEFYIEDMKLVNVKFFINRYFRKSN